MFHGSRRFFHKFQNLGVTFIITGDQCETIIASQFSKELQLSISLQRQLLIRDERDIVERLP